MRYQDVSMKLKTVNKFLVFLVLNSQIIKIDVNLVFISATANKILLKKTKKYKKKKHKKKFTDTFKLTNMQC